MVVLSEVRTLVVRKCVEGGGGATTAWRLDQPHVDGKKCWFATDEKELGKCRPRFPFPSVGLSTTDCQEWRLCNTKPHHPQKIDSPDGESNPQPPDPALRIPPGLDRGQHSGSRSLLFAGLPYAMPAPTVSLWRCN